MIIGIRFSTIPRYCRNTEAGEKLWSRVEHSPTLGAVEFTLPATSGRLARTICQTLYRETLTLPTRKGVSIVIVTALLAREDYPPTGEKAIVWRLLINRPQEANFKRGSIKL